MGAALLTPGSLAMIQAVFRREDRARAIGSWSGLGGIAAAIGPFLGGLVADACWRWIFLINAAARRRRPAGRAPVRARDPRRPSRRFDVLGAVLAALALGGMTYGLIEWRQPLAAAGARSSASSPASRSWWSSAGSASR